MNTFHKGSSIILLLINVVWTKDSCNDNQFLCTSGQCIAKEFICDGATECFDRSDETTDLCRFRSCNEQLQLGPRTRLNIFTLSVAGYFRCGYGACISQQFVCDGIKNCIDGSDETEELCLNFQCKRNYFKCAYGGCVTKHKVCNNRYNCVDCSDETIEACQKRKKRCRISQFACDTGSCIQKKNKCNGVADCLDGTDESEATCGPRPGLVISKAVQLHAGHSCFAPVASTSKPVRPPLVVPLVSAVEEFVPFESSSNKTVEGESTHCSGEFETGAQVDIFHCGGQSCDSSTSDMPIGSTIAVTCPESDFETLICEKDGLWHHLVGVGVPRKTVCSASVSVDGPAKETGTGAVIDVIPDISTPPEDCGKGTLNTHPWLVGLFRQGRFSCSGTLIGPDVVLTAGHCVVRNQASGKGLIDVTTLTIQHHGNKFTHSGFKRVLRISLHPRYLGGSSPKQDLALIKLEAMIEEGSPACVGDFAKLAGITAVTFNRTEGTMAYRWDTFVQSFDPRCFNRISKCSQHIDIGENQFCGTNQNSFLFLHPGSSGGPYIIDVGGPEAGPRWTIAGVVSNAVGSSVCLRSHSVFEAVTEYRRWIFDCGFRNKC